MSHRSIVRIKRNENTRRSINFCTILVLYLFLNWILKKYIIILNSVTLGVLCCGGGIIYCWKRSEDNVDSESDFGELSDSESDGMSSSDLNNNNESPTSTDEINIYVPSKIQTVIAVPISLEEF